MGGERTRRIGSAAAIARSLRLLHHMQTHTVVRRILHQAAASGSGKPSVPLKRASRVSKNSRRARTCTETRMGRNVLAALHVFIQVSLDVGRQGEPAGCVSDARGPNSAAPRTTHDFSSRKQFTVSSDLSPHVKPVAALQFSRTWLISWLE